MGNTDKANDSKQLQALAEAFQLFRVSSTELEASYGALQDEVKRLNTELAAANRRLALELDERELLLNLLPGAVLVLSPTGVIEKANGLALEFFGSLNRHVPWRQALSNSVEAIEGSEDYLVTYNTSRKRLALTVSSRPDPGGQILLFTDVTEARQREKERRRRERLVEMGRMAANLAHQLRTPLSTAVLYFSQLDGRSTDNERRQLYLDRGLAQLHRLELLVRDTLSYVRVRDSDGQSCSARKLWVALDKTYTPLFRQKNVTLSAIAPPNLILTGSLEGWESVIGNLLTNALHFTPPGRKVVLNCSATDDQTLIDVLDEGKGIEEQIKDQLFEPFFTTRPDGTGLGLSIARDYLESIGARLQATNVAGGGCRMLITLPASGTKLAKGK